MYNHITLVGNISQEAKYHETNSGTSMAVVYLATNRYVGGQKKSDFHKIVIWDEKKTNIIKQYTRVGSKILISGFLTYNPWTDQHGQSRQTPEIHVSYGGNIELLDSKGDYTSNTTATTNSQPEGTGPNNNPYSIDVDLNKEGF